MPKLNVQHFIKLVTENSLEKKHVRKWFKAVQESAPSGTMHFVQTIKEGDGPQNVQLIHQKDDGKHHYIIPLTRDLIEDEVNPVFQQWMAHYPNGDFHIESSDDAIAQVQADIIEIEIEDTSYQQLCEKFAKVMHQRWYEDKAEEGWRYGLKLNEDDKTHPMLRPWDDLPEAYQDVDYNLPELLMNVLDEEGYAIVERKELDKLLKM